MIKHTLAVCAVAVACAPHVVPQKRQTPTTIQEVKYNGTFRDAFVQAESRSQYLREK